MRSLGDLVEELAAADVLHDEVDLGLGDYDLEELDDVGVAHAAEDGDLALDVGDEAAFQDLLFVDHLDGHALVGLDVARVVHLREGPVPQELPDFEPPQEEGVVLRFRGGGGARDGAVLGGRLGHSWWRNGERFVLLWFV